MKFSSQAVSFLALCHVMHQAVSDPISPSTVNESLEVGESVDVEKTVTTTAVPQNLEFCLLSDATGSFFDDQSNLEAAAPGIKDAILAQSPGAKFGYAAFKDTGDNFVYSLEQTLTTDADAWLDAINTLSIGGGGDFPEAQYDGIACATDIDYCPMPPGYSTADCGFSDPSVDPSRRVLVVTTDATFSTQSDIQNNEASTTQALNDADVTLIGLKAGSAGPELDALAAATGGNVQPLTSNGSNIATAILDGLANLPTTVGWELVNCDPSLFVTLTPASQEVISGSDAVFGETITAVADGCGIVTCTVEFTSNGASLGAQSISVDMTDDTPPSITCPPDQELDTDIGEFFATATLPTPTITDNCDNLSLPAISGTFPVGTTPQTYTAIDSEGNSATCSFNVIVKVPLCERLCHDDNHGAYFAADNCVGFIQCEYGPPPDMLPTVPKYQNCGAATLFDTSIVPGPVCNHEAVVTCGNYCVHAGRRLEKDDKAQLRGGASVGN